MRAWLTAACVLIATGLFACTSRDFAHEAPPPRVERVETGVGIELAERIARHGSRMLAAGRIEAALISAMASDFLMEGGYGAELMTECERAVGEKAVADGT